MSFLNPVSEPVKRFSSTDASAPQINYNARVAGDVKTVLKACLVTGYGTKASAGWSIVNEVDHVAEFVSPSAAMSDYRLGIDDTSTSSTTWYYQYQNARVNPTQSSIKKSLNRISKTDTRNGWSLLVTERGLILLEFFVNSDFNILTGRVTFFGQIKTAFSDISAQNIGFWCVGHESPAYSAWQFYSDDEARYSHYDVSGYKTAMFAGTNIGMLSNTTKAYSQTVSIDVINPLYLFASSLFLGEQVGVLAIHTSNLTDLYGVRELEFEGRQVLYMFTTIPNLNESEIIKSGIPLYVYLDYWEY